MGACLMLRRQALEEVGFLDERFFMYLEEVDLCYRLKKHGWKIYFVPHGSIIHWRGRSVVQNRIPMILAHSYSLAQFYRKHYASGMRVFFFLVFILFLSASAVLRVCVYSVQFYGGRTLDRVFRLLRPKFAA